MDSYVLEALHKTNHSAFTAQEHADALKNNLLIFDEAMFQKNSQVLPQEDSLRVDVKCMMNQEFHVLKERLTKSRKTNLVDIKIEYTFYVERSHLKQKYLSENYNQEEDLVQIILLCSQGMKSPTAQDFQLYLECVALGANQFKKEIETKINKTLYRLLICACIFNDQDFIEILINKLSKNLQLESAIKILMICQQYEQPNYSMHFFTILVDYFQYDSGVLSELRNPQLQEILYNISSSYITFVDQDIFMLHTPKYKLKIDSIFFKPLLKQLEAKKKQFFQPLQKYQFFKNFRSKANENNLQNTYPHVFRLKDEAEQKLFMVAYQESPHGEILLFSQEQTTYQKFSEHYLGAIERNYWGTSFQVYDFGYPENVYQKFPRYFGSPRKLLVQIEYQTNIMASQPRKFTATMLNFVNNQQMDLIQLEPVYNAEKDCYQLNFYGRAKRASARNFEMIDPYDHNIIYLLHGKWEKNLFNLDYRYPMTMAQAFSFSLVSISKKFLVA